MGMLGVRRLKRATNSARTALRGSTVGALFFVGVLTAGTAGAEPKNETSPVAKLVNQIAAVDQNLADLSSAVETKKQNVNKTLVDFQNAIAAQGLAAAADDSAQASLRTTKKKVDAAQREFDAFLRTLNRQGNNLGSMTDYVSSSDPEKVLEKVTGADQFARHQRTVIRNLQQLRSQQSNRAAATKVARKQTAAAAKGAENRRNVALAAVTDARKAISEERGKRSALLNQRKALVQKLNTVKGGKSKAPALSEVLGVPPPTKIEGDPEADPAAAIAKLALDAGQELIAALIGDPQVPQSELLNELGIGGMPLNGSLSGNGSLLNRLGFLGGEGGQVQPGLRGAQGIEVVVNRMKSQLGVPYAWGGGNANGPTLGVRDGGVADSYGDYNKVGFDCSGLMVYGFAAVGIDLPKYSGYQFTAGPQFPLSEMKRGDMLFWGPGGSAHVALYLGDGTMLESPASGDVVKISPVRPGALSQVVRML
ncbi:hydrolase Nlp/P60 [Gordonia iterans]|uniref:Hydrolase Nlp/P60 n=1 Tax=Gordonia iterans TaxID=1004901 RepID=A0A2S0KGA4_9ACTN|nr:hydrolase Nlp/P60 [Gordonia iterans]